MVNSVSFLVNLCFEHCNSSSDTLKQQVLTPAILAPVLGILIPFVLVTVSEVISPIVSTDKYPFLDKLSNYNKMIERDTELQKTSEPAIAYSTCYAQPFIC
jgi:ABC-type spermidine/putrescine transport system permease subunit I